MKEITVDAASLRPFLEDFLEVRHDIHEAIERFRHLAGHRDMEYTAKLVHARNCSEDHGTPEQIREAVIEKWRPRIKELGDRVFELGAKLNTITLDYDISANTCGSDRPVHLGYEVFLDGLTNIAERVSEMDNISLDEVPAVRRTLEAIHEHADSDDDEDSGLSITDILNSVGDDEDDEDSDGNEEAKEKPGFPSTNLRKSDVHDLMEICTRLRIAKVKAADMWLRLRNSNTALRHARMLELDDAVAKITEELEAKRKELYDNYNAQHPEKPLILQA